MTAPHALEKSRTPRPTPALVALSLLFAPPAAADELRLTFGLRPTLYDYELPGHPRTTGRGGAGTLGAATLIYRYKEILALEAGFLGRLPFAVDFLDELDAFPVFSATLTPFGDNFLLRFGSLDIRHGFHGALLDEPRYAYGRPVEETYNQSLLPAGQKDLGRDLRMPVENGAQLKAKLGDFSAELYLDWQLLETQVHREKFAVGVLGHYQSRWLSGFFQYRLLHYGGQLYTQAVETRRLGLDNKRQPTSLAVGLTPRWPGELFQVELPLSFVQGRVIQTPGGTEETHWGAELGADLIFWRSLRLGYRAWLPKNNLGRWISEDSDPVYAGPRSHRARIALSSRFEAVELSGRLDLVFPAGSDKVQYLTVSTLSFYWERLLMDFDDEYTSE